MALTPAEIDAIDAGDAHPPVKLPDGSIGTVRSIGVGDQHGEWVIPTIVNGTPVSSDDAIKLWRQGQNAPLGGPFSTIDEANAFAVKFHESEANRLGIPSRSMANAYSPQQIDAIPVDLTFKRPASTTASATDGGKPLQVGQTPITEDLIDVVKDVPRAIGKGFGEAGKAVKAVVADTAAGMRGSPEFSGNIPAFVAGEEMPIDKAIQDAYDEAKARNEFPVAGMMASTATGMAKALPKIAALPVAGPGLLAQSIAAGGLFGLDDEGNFSPKEALIGALLPGVGKFGRVATASLLGRAVVAGSETAARPIVQKIAETLGEQASLDAYMTAVNSPELIDQYKNDPMKFKESMANIIGGNLAFGLLGAERFKREVPSDTQMWIKNQADALSAKAVQQRIVEDYPPDALKDIFTRVSNYNAETLGAQNEGRPIDPSIPVATPEEENLVRYINEQMGGKPGEATRSGVRITTEHKDLPETQQFWRDYLGLPKTEKTLEVMGQGEQPQTKTRPRSIRLLSPAQIDAVPVEGEPNAVNPIVQQGGVPNERRGVNEVGQTGPEASTGNSLPSPAGQPAPASTVGKRLTPNPKWQVTVQPSQVIGGETVNGGVQIDSIENGKNEWSSNPEELNAKGYDMPDLSGLPAGRYSLEEAVYMLGDKNAVPPPTKRVAFKPITAMTQDEYAAHLANKGLVNGKRIGGQGGIYRELVKKPEFRGVDTAIPTAESEAVYAQMDALAKAGGFEEGTSGWASRAFGDSKTKNPDGTRSKAYVTFNDYKDFTPALVKQYTDELQASGFNGQVKIPGKAPFNAWRLVQGFDNIVIHARTQAEADAAGKLAQQVFGNVKVSFGLDPKGTSHTDELANRVAAAINGKEFNLLPRRSDISAPQHTKPSLMNNPPPGGWKPEDKVPEQYRNQKPPPPVPEADLGKEQPAESLLERFSKVRWTPINKEKARIWPAVEGYVYLRDNTRTISLIDDAGKVRTMWTKDGNIEQLESPSKKGEQAYLDAVEVGRKLIQSGEFRRVMDELKDAFRKFGEAWKWKGNDPGETYSKYRQTSSTSKSSEKAVKAAILKAKQDGPTPEFRALFGGIDPKLVGTTSEKVAAYAKDLGILYRPVNETAPSKPPIPETPATLDEQVQMLVNGKRDAILITPGEQAPEYDQDEFLSVKTPHGEIIYNPSKLTTKKIKDAVKADKLGDILGYGIPSKPAPGTEIGAVVVRTPAGVEKQGVLTDATHLKGVTEAAQKVASPDDTISIESEAQVIKKRGASIRGKEPKKWTEVGVNNEGNKVYEDDNGVRSYVKKGIRVTEPVSLIPTREGIQTGVDRTVSRPEFQTVDEISTGSKLPADVNQPTEGGSGSSGSTGGQPATVGAPSPGEQTGTAAEGAAGPLQPAIRADDGGQAADGGAGGSRIADADANGVPAERQPEAPVIPSGDTGVETSPSVRGEPTEANPAPEPEIGAGPRPRNIRLAENPAPTGAVARIKANIDAIALVKKLEAENRFPTEEERKTLAMWSGWGSFAEMFNESRAEKRDWDVGWMKRYGSSFDKLQKLLTPDEFNAAVESSSTAHYTSQEVVSAMWDLARRLGYRGGRALEPSTGSGVFVGYMPGDLATTTRWTGSEMEPITGKIFKYLYPEVDTRIEPFENTRLPNGFYDLAITNVPFHEVGPGKEYPDLNLHNYFIARMLDKVKPGGLVMVVTSAYTMDSKPEQRALLADKGQLVGAIRLPNTAFKSTAGTEVVTDIIVLRKPDGKPFDSQAWKNTQDLMVGDDKARVNEYYARNPDMVLGKHALTGTMYRKNSYTVEATAGPLAEKLAAALAKFPENIVGREEVSTTFETTTLEEGTLSVDAKGHVLEARNFQIQSPTSWDPSSPSLVKRAKLYIGLRDTLKEQYRIEDDPNATDAQIEANRAKLNRSYQAMVREVGGTVNQNERKMGYLSTDPDFYTVMGIEVFREAKDPKNPEATITVVEPAAVLSQRVISPDIAPTTAENATEALGISMAYKGGLDMDYVKQLTGMSDQAIETELMSSDLGFKDPESGRFVTSLEYLTGDVREKLAKAIFAAKESDEFARNVEALKRVIPQTEPFGKIKLGLTARWVPTAVFNLFARDVIGLNGDEISFVPGIEEFAVSAPRRQPLSDKARVGWSTADMTAPMLLSHAMNFRRARIMRRTFEKKYVEDSDASALANQIIDKMSLEFQQWVRTTDARAPLRYFDADRGDYVTAELPVWDVLEREYNRRMNSFVAPKNDGSSLKLPGLSNLVTRKQHLLDGVMRAIVGGSAVYGHGVGSGKTFLAIVAMHELKRVGLMKKGVIVVKKPTTDQFRLSMERAYPGSRVLMPSKKDFEPANRKKLAARVASGKWDAIILTHEQFKAIRTSEESVNAFFNDQIEQLRAILREMGEEDAEEATSTRGLDPAVRNIVKKLKSLKKRLTTHTESIKKKQDVGIEWEKLGIDGVWIDESHNFKKMPIPTQMENVKGIPSDFSQRAVDLLIKIRDVQRRTNGRNVFFASGTPVSNTLAELWVMFHATNPQLLKDFSIETFDSFATAYAETVSNFELGWDDKFKDVTRMSRFKNPGSLTLLTRLGMDVRIGNKELGLDVPDIHGGKPKVHIIKPSRAFERWLKLLDDISTKWDYLDAKGRFENSWIPITTMRAGVAAALDPRCVFPDAEDDPNSKVNTAIREIIAEFNAGKERRTTMMVFADMYRTMKTAKLMAFLSGSVTNPDDTIEVELPESEEGDDTGDTGSADANAFEANAVGKFNLYEDIRRKLIAAGVPTDQIAIITEHDTDAKRNALFNKVRSGSVRILMGSTEKIGEGVDVPQRMSAQFHLDPPMGMTPAKLEQRIGRIIRQGNLHSPKNWNLPVWLHLFAQERSMDAAIYQMLETKSVMVTQALKGQFLGDEFDDPVGELTATMMEMKAAATGDNRVLELAKLTKEVRDLSLEEGAFQRRVSELRREVDIAGYQASHQKQEAEKYTAISQAVGAEMADKDATVLTHKDKRYVGQKAIDSFLEKARPAFEDALKVEGSKAVMHMKLGTQVNVTIEGRHVVRQQGDSYVHTNQFSATFYIGPELNHGVPQWASNLNSIESLLTAANGVSNFAQKRAIAASESAAEAERLGAAYAQQFKDTQFTNSDVLKEKRARLYELESVLRNEGQRKKEKPAEVDLTPPLDERIRAQIAEATGRLDKVEEDITRAEGRIALTGGKAKAEAKAELHDLQDIWRAVDKRIIDLERRLAVAVKYKNPTTPTDIPPTDPDPSYDIEPTPTSEGEEFTVRGLKELATLLRNPQSGMTPDAVRVALDLLNTPVMQNLDWSNLTIALRNRFEAGYSGNADVVQNLIEMAKGSRPTTFPHEVFHFLYRMLAPADRAMIEQARMDALRREYESFNQLGPLPPDAAGLFDQLATGKMASDAFIQVWNRLKVENPDAAKWWATMYDLINASEFMAGMAGRRFTAESFDSQTYTWFGKFLTKLLSWVRAIIDTVRRAFGVRPSMEQIYREMLSGQRVTTPETGAEYEGVREGQFEGEPIANAGIDPTELEIETSKAEEMAVREGWIKTEVLGRQDSVRGRETLSDAERSAGADYAKKVLDMAGLQVTQQDNGLWRLTDPTFESEIEGRKLLDLLSREIAIQNQPGAVTGYLGNLLNSVVVNMTQDATTAFSPELRRDLYSVAQGERSQRGLLLAALAGFGKTVDYVARNVDVVLSRVYSDKFGGDEIRKVLSRVLSEFRGIFTDQEIETILGGHPDFKTTMSQIIDLNRRDEGGRVYRRAQSLLKPKNKKKLSRLESDVRVTEAVNEILQQLKAQGIEPKPSPNKPISPLQRLLLLVQPENAKKIDTAIAHAIQDAERNAGIKAALKSAQSADERQELLERFSAGEEPDQDMIDIGLEYPEYTHWKALRDDLLAYSPTTLKVVRNLIRADFKGVRFGAKPVKNFASTKIDLPVLSKQPDDEVRRVINAYSQNLDENMVLNEATEETRLRVIDDVHREVTDQLERIRRQMRDMMFANPPTKGTPLTPEQRMAQLINAGIFKDERLDVPAMVDRLAEKSALEKLTPKLSDLIKQVFSTPFYRQSELPQRFSDVLIKKLSVTPEQAEAASRVFATAFDKKLALARTAAFKKAMESLTPREKKALRPGKGLWKKIEEATNAGVFDTGAVLQSVARAQGWFVPTDSDIARVKAWSAEMQRLNELSALELRKIGADPAKLADALRDKRAATLEKRIAIKRKIETQWSKMTHPMTLGTAAGRTNIAHAINEFTSANLLFKVGFAPRLAIDILTQGALHTPTRAVAAAIARYQTDKSAGGHAVLWDEINSALRDAYRVRLAATKANLVNARQALAGAGDARNIDRLVSRIAVFERMEAKAEELALKGDKVRAGALRLLHLISFSYRIAQTLDNFQGLPAEYQEMRQQVETSLRENGMSKAEAQMNADKVIGDMKAEWSLAIGRVQEIFDANGLQAKPNELKSAAWQVVKSRQYARMKALGLPADDFEEINRVIRSTVAWAEREDGGIGGWVGTSMRKGTEVMAGLGLPFPLARFSNAIATSINRKLMFTPLGFFPGAFKDSPWMRTEEDRLQRKVEASVGTAFGLLIASLVLGGVLKVWLKPPQDKEERDLWEKEGHRANTIEIPTGDGGFIPISLLVGPMALVSPYAAGAGAVKDARDLRDKLQQRLNEEAARTGATPGNVRSLTAADYLGIATSVAANALTGGRTAVGLTSSFTDQGLPNANKFVSALLSPVVPGLPALQEMSRMAGVALDPKMATVLDFMLPLPTSAAAKVNVLGDSVGTDDAIQRIVQILTGGTFPFPVQPTDAHTQAGYQALFDSGYRPPSINPDKGYAIDGEVRPMTNSEIERYTVLRGQYLKEALANMPAGATRKQVAAAYADANARALEDLGVTTKTPSRTAAPTPSRPQFPAPRGAARVARRIGRGRSRVSRGPSLRRGRGMSISGRGRPRGYSVRRRR